MREKNEKLDNHEKSFQSLIKLKLCQLEKDLCNAYEASHRDRSAQGVPNQVHASQGEQDLRNAFEASQSNGNFLLEADCHEVKLDIREDEPSPCTWSSESQMLGSLYTLYECESFSDVVPSERCPIAKREMSMARSDHKTTEGIESARLAVTRLNSAKGTESINSATMTQVAQQFSKADAVSSSPPWRQRSNLKADCIEHLELRPLWLVVPKSSKRKASRFAEWMESGSALGAPGGPSLRSGKTTALTPTLRSGKTADVCRAKLMGGGADPFGEKQESWWSFKLKWMVLDPHCWPVFGWDFLGMGMLILDMILIPMQVFELPQGGPLEFYNWFALLYWTITMFMTFILGYQGKDLAIVVMNPRAIVMNYLKGWFLLDLFIVAADWASTVIDIVSSHGGEDFSNARLARAARLGRLLRTLRLLRIMRVGAMLQKLETMIDSEYLGIITLIACNMLSICFLGHLVACLLYWVGTLQHAGGWLQVYNISDTSIYDQYLNSLGWSLSTLLASTVSTIVAGSKSEYVCSMAVAVLGTIIVALIVSSTTAAMTRLQQLRAEERDAKYKLKSFLKQNHISVDLGARVIRYAQLASKVHRKRFCLKNVALIELLSGHLRVELQMELYSPFLTLHPFIAVYHSISKGAMGELCMRAVDHIHMSKGDVLFRVFSHAQNMYFLIGGVVMYRRAKGAKSTRPITTITRNNYFSEATLWLNWVHRGSMMAMIESDALALDVDLFCSITKAHRDVLVEAHRYAKRFLDESYDEIDKHKYIWDVRGETMYNASVSSDGRPSSTRRSLFFNGNKDGDEPVGSPMCDMIEADCAFSAEVLDFDSGSDSDDERMFNFAFGREQAPAEKWVHQESLAHQESIATKVDE